MDGNPLADRLSAMTALDDPARRAVYDLVCRRDEPVSRDQTASALGVTRRSAAFHLDRLAELGLLAVEFRRLTGRTGPGAGRPAKLYRRAYDEIAVSVPERRYDLAGEVMAAAIERSLAGGEPIGEALRAVATDAGYAIGSAATDLRTALRDHGFDPRDDPHGGLRLGNCPFHRLAARRTGIVCGLNLDLIRGIAAGLGDATGTAVLAPSRGHCCVRIGRAAAAPARPDPLTGTDAVHPCPGVRRRVSGEAGCSDSLPLDRLDTTKYPHMATRHRVISPDHRPLRGISHVLLSISIADPGDR